NSILSKHYNDYIASLHCGHLTNPHVWITDGTGDLHFKDSPVWNLTKHPDCSYQLICSQEPVILDVYMINRHINTLSRKGSSREKSKENINRWLQGIFTVLDNISKKHRYTLVVFWKDLKGTVDFSEEEISPLIDRDDLIAVENGLVLY